MAAVQEEDRLAAAEAGTAGSSAAEQKASIKDALNTPTNPEDIITSVSFCQTQNVFFDSDTSFLQRKCKQRHVLGQ